MEMTISLHFASNYNVIEHTSGEWSASFISQGTLNKLQNGGNVMVDVLEKICLNMHCEVGDIMEIYPDAKSSTENGTGNAVQ